MNNFFTCWPNFVLFRLIILLFKLFFFKGLRILNNFIWIFKSYIKRTWKIFCLNFTFLIKKINCGLYKGATLIWRGRSMQRNHKYHLHYKRVKTLPRLIFYNNNNDQLQFPHAHTLPAFSFFFLIHPHIGIAKLN